MNKVKEIILKVQKEAEDKIEEYLADVEAQDKSLLQYWVGRRDAADVIILLMEQENEL